MSINAPGTIAFTGDVTLSITVTWGTKPSDSTMSINSVTYNLNDVFDKAVAMLKDIATAASCTNRQAELVLKVLQFLIENYNLQAQTANLRLSIAVS